MHAVYGVYTVCIRYPAFLYFSADVCYYFFVQEILTNHRVLGIDISQPDLDLEARQEEKLLTSGDIDAGEGRRGA